MNILIILLTALILMLAVGFVLSLFAWDMAVDVLRKFFDKKEKEDGNDTRRF